MTVRSEGNSKLFSLLDRGLYQIDISVEVKKQMAEYG